MARIKQPEVVPEKPTGSCHNCGGTEYWWDPPNAFGPGQWNCSKCVKEPEIKMSEIIDGVLHGRPVCDVPKPTEPCRVCWSRDNVCCNYWWKPSEILFDQMLKHGEWFCVRCRPKPDNYIEPVMMINGKIQKESPVPPPVSPKPENVPEKPVNVPVDVNNPEYVDKLRQRVAKGNLTLINYYKKIREMEGYNPDVDKTFTEAFETLADLSTELRTRGFKDCPFLVNGVKPRLCWSDKEAVGCFVCPSDIEYWKEENANVEFEKLGGNHVRRNRKMEMDGEDLITFLKTLGGRI